MNALNEQHGGQHYKGMAIQPIEFGMENGYDPCIFSAIKYISRHRQKNGEEDVRKGEHFVFLRLATMPRVPNKARNTMSPKFYCEQNHLGPIESQIIIYLHHWAAGDLEPDDVLHAQHLSNLCNKLIAEQYPHERIDHA